MKILILGGTGAIGTHLTEILSDKGNKVVVTSRKAIKSQKLIEYRQGNAKDQIFLESLLKEKWDAIVDFMNYSTRLFSKRVDLLLKSTPHYIFLSTSRVYAESQKPLIEESLRLLDFSKDKDYLTTDEYALSKARQENRLHFSERKNYTIIRPYITYSEKRLQLGPLEKENWLYRAMQGKTIVFSRDILNCMTTLTYGLDVANGIASLIGSQKPFGETYHITNKYSIKWSKILKIYLDELEKKLGTRPKIIYQDQQNFLEWNGKYQIIYDRLFNRKFDNSKINRYLNTEEFVKTENGLKKCLGEFLLNPEFKKIDWRVEAIKDRITHEKTKIKEIRGLKGKFFYFLFMYLIGSNNKIYKLLKFINKTKGKIKT